MRPILLCVFVAGVACLAMARKGYYPSESLDLKGLNEPKPLSSSPSVNRASPSYLKEQDTEMAAGHHGGGHGHGHGRVQIKVYRGQSKGGNGWGGWDFAPFGYWVRQPADNHGWGWSG